MSTNEPKTDGPDRLGSLGRWLSPLAWVYLVAAGIHVLHAGFILGGLPTWLLCLLLVPLLGVETIATARFAQVTPRALLGGDGPRWALRANLTFWLVVFLFWVVAVGDAAMTTQVWLQWFGTEFWWPVGLVWKGGGAWTLIAAGLWLATYHLVVVRRRRARILVALVMPVALTFALMALILRMGGPGGLVDEAERTAAGARLAYDIRSLTPRLDPAHPDRIRSMANIVDGDFGPVREHSEVCTNPRSVCAAPDGSAVHAFFGCTWGASGMFFPAVVRLEPATGRVDALAGHNVRQVSCGAERFAVAPWDTEGIYEIGSDDLSLHRMIPHQTTDLLAFWEPLDVLIDRDRSRAIVANNGETAVLIYELQSGKLQRVVNLAKMGLVRAGGGGVHRMRQSPKTGLVYGVTGPGVNLFELDPAAGELTRTLDVGDVVGTGLAADFEAGRLYYQSGFTGDLHEVDLATFQVIRTLDGEVHARRLALDQRRRVLYVAGYFSGLLVALDLDTGERLWEFGIGPRPQGMDLVDDALWVNTQDGLFEVSLQTTWTHYGYTEARFFPARSGVPFVYVPVDP